jgi:hypothetical protein
MLRNGNTVCTFVSLIFKWRNNSIIVTNFVQTLNYNRWFLNVFLTYSDSEIFYQNFHTVFRDRSLNIQQRATSYGLDGPGSILNQYFQIVQTKSGAKTFSRAMDAANLLPAVNRHRREAYNSIPSIV